MGALPDASLGWRLILTLFNIISTTLLIYWIVRRRAELKKLPRIWGSGCKDCEPVSVIIPARNEGERIGSCLASIAAQRDVELQVIVVDDSSTDGTSDIAARLGAEVVEAGDRPDGWIGKSWPCHVGYGRACGDILIFMDADTVLLRDDVMANAVCTLRKRGLDYLSILPRFRMEDAWTSMTLPLYLNIIFLLEPPSTINKKGSRRCFLIGAFAVIRREAYEAVGDHGAVKETLAEDMALGERLRRSGFRFMLFRGDDAVSAGWGGGLKEVWGALVRVLASVLGPRLGAALLASAATITLFILPLASLPFLAGAPALTALPPILLAASLNGLELRRNGGKIFYALGYPLAVLLMVAALIYVGYRLGRGGVVVEWKGRRYKAKV